VPLAPGTDLNAIAAETPGLVGADLRISPSVLATGRARASDLAEAMGQARAALPAGGVVLLSPGAPSFGMYRDYVARGRHFAELAGFDPVAISGIAGMGIA